MHKSLLRQSEGNQNDSIIPSVIFCCMRGIPRFLYLNNHEGSALLVSQTCPSICTPGWAELRLRLGIALKICSEQTGPFPLVECNSQISFEVHVRFDKMGDHLISNNWTIFILWVTSGMTFQFTALHWPFQLQKLIYNVIFSSFKERSSHRNENR